MKLITKSLALFMGLILLNGLASTDSLAKRRVHSYHENSSPIEGTSRLVQEIDQIIRQIDPNLNIGVHIKSMKYGDEIYTKNEQRSFVPASILKIFTAESALLLLGPDYKFQTSFVTDAKEINEGALDGNLYLVNSGDPSLTYYDIADLIGMLKSKKINQINGNLYIDNSAYDEENYGPGWVWDDKQFCYAAPISASIINHNCLTFHIAPGKKVGRLAVVDNPGYYYSSLKNNVVTKSRRARSCSIQLGETDNNSLVLNGCLPKGHYIQGISTVITDIMRYNKSLVSILLHHSGIQINGDIIAGTAPDDSTIVATHESKPLNTLVTDMMKVSDNIIAGSLFKKLGEIYSKEPGSWENGSHAVKQILSEQIGVDVNQMNITDGSGLSRYNLITPAQMMGVLDFAYHHPGTNSHFISALPVAGIDGTLKHRLRNVAKKVRAKTGTMTGVVALAGYALNRTQEPIAFVIIVNGRDGLGWKYRALEDKIVTALTRYNREMS